MNEDLDLGELHRKLPSVDALLALLAFKKEGDIVRAAKVLQVSQPAISFQLKKLEDTLGFDLFSTSGKRKVLTKIGQSYAEGIERTFSELGQNQDRASRSSEDLTRLKLRISGRRELFLPLLSFPFPGQMELIQSSSFDALAALRAHKVDLAISAQILDSSDLVAKLFFESGLKLVVPKTWKFEIKNEAELMRLPVVVYGNHHAYLDEYLKQKGVRFSDMKVARIVEDWFSVVELVKYGVGWAIVPEAWGIHTDQVQSLSLKKSPETQQRIYLFLRREDRKLPWVAKLDEWLKTVRD